MAFKTVNSLDADVTVSVGGFNKKTRKDNPTRVEGYYLGYKTVADNKKKSGISYIYFLQTPKGNVGVWGKTDMDNKMKTVTPGAMIYIKFDKMVPTPNGEMYKYEVGVDEDNTIEVSTPATNNVSASASSETDTFGSDGETEYSTTDDNDEDARQEAEALLAAQEAAAARKAKVDALLNKSKTK